MKIMTQKVHIRCGGRDAEGQEVLREAIPVTISIRSRKLPIIRGTEMAVEPVDCPYNTGGHGQRCKASHPEQDKTNRDIFCPFSFGYPYLLAENPNWSPPEKIAEEFRMAKKISGYS